jgi:hypothetical protein
MTAIREMYKLSITVHFVSESQISQPLTVIPSDVVTEIKKIPLVLPCCWMEIKRGRVSMTNFVFIENVHWKLFL